MGSSAHLYHSGICPKSLQLSRPKHRPFNLYTHSSAKAAPLSGLAGSNEVSPPASQQQAVSREFQRLGLSEKATSSILKRNPAYLKWDVAQELQPASQQWHDQLGQNVEKALRRDACLLCCTADRRALCLPIIYWHSGSSEAHCEAASNLAIQSESNARQGCCTCRYPLLCTAGSWSA